MTLLRPTRLVAAAALIALPQLALADTLTVGVRAGPDSIDPHFSALGPNSDALKHIYDPLVGTAADLQLEPALATAWEAVDEDTWEFKLREGVTFHDGSAFTAEDVKFSIERIPNVAGPTTTEIYVRRVADVEIIDDHTIHIHTDGPAATLPYDFVRLFIVSSDAAADYSTAETSAEGFNSGTAAIGTGPFKFVEYRPQESITLERFDEYWRGASDWETVVRREIPDDASRLAALKAGDVDVINYVSSADYLALENDSDIETFIGDSVYVMNLQLDQRDQTPRVRAKGGDVLAENPFKDARVRAAIDLAIDRETMVEIVLEGLGTPANQMMPAGFFGFSDKIPEKPYDPDQAKALLAEAGFPDGFEMDLFCTNDRLPGDGAICEALGQMFAQIGIDTDVNAISRTVYFPAQARKEYSAFMNGWGTLTGEASYTLGSLAHSPNEEAKMGAFNRIEYENPEVDRLMQAGTQEADPDKRRALFEEAMELTVADQAYISIVVLQTVWAGNADKVVVTPRADEETLAYFMKPAQ
ncbi:MAG: ABC transporter substrate-binding protein [Pseudomonadota bacterium]